MLRRRFAAALLCAATLAGCGSHTHNAAPSHSVVVNAFKGSPPPLAALHELANRILNGGTNAFKTRLTGLRGYPVVVNKWASWCGPCQSEFPVFQKVAVSYGNRVAFVGLDAKDGPGTARTFLGRYPVTYPSYFDPHQSIANSIQAETYFPQTVFVDRSGKIVYDHVGPYENVSDLERDIKRYALARG